MKNTKRTFYLLAILLAATIPAFSQKAEPTFLVSVEGGKSVTMKAKDLAALPRVEVKIKDHDGADVVYSGVELRSILASAGAKFGGELRGPMIGQYLVISAADGYHAVFSLTELDPEFTDDTVILADKIGGKPLDAKYGPWQVVATGEKKHARMVRQVTTLQVYRAK
ncbi:MAG TPA: hypothetical protein PLR83_00530 [Pyrinomonadaceae bacterium]|nr:hypothetical protein [Pyrinomonadaceae bacterium]